MAATAKKNIFIEHYDRFIALAAVVVLAVSGAMLMGGGESAGDALEKQRQSLKPANPEIQGMADTAISYTNALAHVGAPYVIPAGGSSPTGFFVPLTRIWCANPECLAPIDRDCQTCPACGTSQPGEKKAEVNFDTDGDGLPDEWEKKYGLNPQLASDAELDSDGDTFTNLEEFKFGTDPMDAKSHPDLVSFLRVESIEATRLPLILKEISGIPGGKNQINYFDKNSGRTYTCFVKVGEKITADNGKIVTDYTLVSVTNKVEEVKKAGIAVAQKRNIPYAVIQSGAKPIEIRQDTPANDNDYRVTLVNTYDNTAVTVSGDEEFKIADGVFKIIKVEKSAQSVIIKETGSNREIKVGRDSASL